MALLGGFPMRARQRKRGLANRQASWCIKEAPVMTRALHTRALHLPCGQLASQSGLVISAFAIKALSSKFICLFLCRNFPFAFRGGRWATRMGSPGVSVLVALRVAVGGSAVLTPFLSFLVRCVCLFSSAASREIS